jgi:hypothetical protein
MKITSSLFGLLLLLSLNGCAETPHPYVGLVVNETDLAGTAYFEVRVHDGSLTNINIPRGMCPFTHKGDVVQFDEPSSTNAVSYVKKVGEQ